MFIEILTYNLKGKLHQRKFFENQKNTQRILISNFNFIDLQKIQTIFDLLRLKDNDMLIIKCVDKFRKICKRAQI